MSVQLSIYWQAADQLQWYWSGDAEIHSGTLEELQDQKQQKNNGHCLTRLFLPANWFTTLDIQLPSSVRSVTPTLLKFATEEYLAQDIDSVHLVLKGKGRSGNVSVIVTEIERFRNVIQTLSARQFSVLEAFDAKWFTVAEETTEDVLIKLEDETVSVYANSQIYTIHYRGFTQWFELWLDQQGFEEEPSVRLISQSAEGIARKLSTELEAAGHELQWIVQSPKNLKDWHEQANQTKHSGNLISGEFSQGQGDKKLSLWLPSLVASVLVLVLWSVSSVLQVQRINKQTAQTWEASEQVFRQVFGQSKRIQRPLMVREMRTLAANSGSQSDEKVNALTIFSDLTNADANLTMEDFRYNHNRLEVNFTLVQANVAEGDAYANFEALKSQLLAKNYEIEYSANQDSDSYRARFKATVGGE